MKMLESGCVHKWLEQLKNICEGLIVNKNMILILLISFSL